MAFLKNRTPAIVVGILIILALLGLYGSVTANPTRFIQGIAVVALVGLAIYFLARKFSNSSPQKKEQRAFLKAAKKSKKRLHQKSGESTARTSSLGTLTSIKKSTKTKKESTCSFNRYRRQKG